MIITLTPNELCELLNKNNTRYELGVAEDHKLLADDLEKIEIAVDAAILKAIAAHAGNANNIIREEKH